MTIHVVVVQNYRWCAENIWTLREEEDEGNPIIWSIIICRATCHKEK
jgi:hypothetical protein